MKPVRLIKRLLRRWLIVVGIVVVSLLVAFRLYERRGPHVVEEGTVIVQSAPFPEGDRLVYEDMRVKIYIDYDDFKDYLAERVEQEEVPGIRERIAQEMDVWRDEVDAQLQEQGPYHLNYSEHEFFIAEMLESGRASVWNQQDGWPVDTILVRRHTYSCGALCSRGFRSFYFARVFIVENDRPLFPLRGLEFFKVTDWVS